MISVKDIKQYIKPTSPTPIGGVALCAAVMGAITLISIFVFADMPYRYTFVSDVVLIAMCLFVLHRWKPWQPVTPKFSVSTAVLITGFFGTMWLAGQAAGAWFMTNVQDTSYDAYTEALGSMDMAVYLLLTSVIAPMAEEYFFRGVLLKAFAWYWTPFWAIIIQAILFAAMHQTVTHMIPTFLVGLYNGFLVYRTGHVWPAVIAHMTNNLMAIVAFTPISELIPWLFEDPWCWLGLCLMVGCAIAICVSDMTDNGLFLVLPAPIRYMRGTSDVITSSLAPIALLDAPKSSINFDWDEDTDSVKDFPDDPWPV